MELLKLSNQLCFPLYALSRKITSHYLPILEKLGLTYPQYLVMLVLWDEHKLSVKELGERLMLDSGTLSPLLKKLQEKHLLTRTRSREDERVVLIELTDTGLSLKNMATGVPNDIMCSLQISIEEMDQMRKLASGMLEKLNQLEPA
ncbi:MarR family transcriptional regulator [Dyadobacter luteus]|uniref:MarR family transcriptional regulator n=1 Tax=Dyadobacter luteus TaxID=2259619 RepID=A0A3D8Y8C3_9BACT|nr:MarR family transcriptional regulator [Dyadobacter luteus]REA57618.1 MarR family transcriptional regulator [Dyadobacter luteus]